MKTLNLIRHGEAEDTFNIKNDFLRNLSINGISDLTLLDEYLLQFNFKKHKILCSSSNRTKETFNLLNESLNPASNIVFTSDLYLATFKSLLQIINIESTNSNMLTLIGHNPGLSDLLSYITNDYDIQDIGTSTFISFSFSKKINDEVIEGAGKVEHFIQSKNSKIINL